MTKNYYSRETMKQEILDDIGDYEEVNEDNITEIADGLVPIYNIDLINFCHHYDGEEFWYIWNDNELGYETPLDILRGNIYSLYLQIGYEVLRDIKKELV